MDSSTKERIRTLLDEGNEREEEDKERKREKGREGREKGRRRGGRKIESLVGREEI